MGWGGPTLGTVLWPEGAVVVVAVFSAFENDGGVDGLGPDVNDGDDEDDEDCDVKIRDCGEFLFCL